MHPMSTVLFVCTGNQCRSPMAESIARRELDRAGYREVTVISAGLLATGMPATPLAIRVLARRGLDISAHRSRHLDEALSPVPDLVVGMAREHAREVVDRHPETFFRTFTLKDLAARAADTGPRADGQPLSEYLAMLGRGRGFASLAGFSAADDLADPIGQAPAVYELCVADIDRLVCQLVAHLWPLGR